MKKNSVATRKKHFYLRIISLSVLSALIVTSIFLYRNFNKLLSDALLKSFNATLVSDVYELKFENLRINVLKGNIRVYNVSLIPREEPLANYPYINSSFRLTTDEINLEGVDIRTLLYLNKINLKSISIIKPDIEVTLTAKRNIMLPFKSAATKPDKEGSTKKSLGAFMLTDFQLIDAAFHVTNSYKQREFNIKDLDIELHDLQLNQQPSEYFTSFDQVTLAIGEFKGDLQKGPLKYVGFRDFKIGIDTLSLQLNLDTIMYRFHDFNTGMHDLDIQTADSLFHISMESFDLSYGHESVRLREISFKPNVSHGVLQNRFKFQYTEFSGTIGKVELMQVNFDSLIYGQKVFIDEIELDNIKASIFKDKTKPMDSARRPVYLAAYTRIHFSR